MRAKQKITYSMKNPTPQLSGDVNKWFKEEYQHLADTLCGGDKFAVTKIAKEEQLYLSEYLRAIYVLQTTNSFAELSKYSISYNVYKDILINYKQIDLPNSSEEEVVLNLNPSLNLSVKTSMNKLPNGAKITQVKKLK